MTVSAIRCIALVALITPLTLACGPEEEPPKYKEKIEGKVEVNLPEKPNLDSILKATRVYPDGSLSVTGIVLERNEYIGKQVKLKGLVRSSSEDCPFLTDPKQAEKRPRVNRKQAVGTDGGPCGPKPERTCSKGLQCTLDPKGNDICLEMQKCPTVHTYLADGPFSPKEMLIVNYEPFFHPHLIKNVKNPDFEIIVEGLYDFTDGRFHRPGDGLIIVQDVLNMKVDSAGNLYTKQCTTDEECAKPDGSKVKCLDLTDIDANGGGEHMTWCQPEEYVKPEKKQ